MADTPIVRHVKIRQEANSYDPEQEMYFEERWMRKWKRTLRGTSRTLWVLQDGTCPRCRQKLDLSRGWHVHPLCANIDETPTPCLITVEGEGDHHRWKNRTHEVWNPTFPV